MNFYIATKLENHAAHNQVRDRLAELGHTLTYDWTAHGPVYGSGLERVREVAVAEAKGVADADAVIVLWPGGRGTHVEMGMALALRIPVFFCSPLPEHHEATPETCAFYHHPRVRRSTTLTQLFEQIQDLVAMNAGTGGRVGAAAVGQIKDLVASVA